MAIGPRPVLEDVARLAGVSLGSASRALSVPELVKPATLERVNRAVEQLGYVRNGSARALASRRTMTIAAIYPSLDNPIFAVSIQSLQQTLWDLGYQLLVASHDYRPEREVGLLRSFVERGVDAVVLVGTDHDDAVFELLSQYKIPYVLTWSVDTSSQRPCVGFSYFDAAFKMAQAVIEYGHTEIALCPGQSYRNERVRARILGTQAALESAGLKLRPEWIIEQPFTFEGGRSAVRQVLGGVQRPTVLICGNDLIAIGAMAECREQNIYVPVELSITGSDDIELANMVDPPLTTVHVPKVEIGSFAAHRVVSLIEGATALEVSPLSTRVVIRGSLRKVT
ncbi:LacI family transcriptional regulator [Limnohabitans sp. TS-CS-82]|jgi:LacI family transcriptional regulator|uniref:LacI family DNA-binding transcriptional regulator n=1 Tax=Limnohabitans sp. TS-CS-82 TaxID=2094193 RepID=UPI000CF2305A|nr:LacI family DNA-binding transcriptional regulator [Limnohabitans sp. TS-CS-82]PQA80482.1 LacI family transcriptional regulator [Limnohabitans sp. TS-CS-82]